MKILFVSLASFISAGLIFIGYLFYVFQTDNVQNSIFTWERESRFELCTRQSNVSLEQRISLPESTKVKIDSELQVASPDTYFQLGVKYIQGMDGQVSEQDGFSIGMYVLMQAAEQGDAVAMNEIGVALAYCDQGVRQDMEAAKHWFERSSDLNDEYALYNLASLHFQNIGPFVDKSKGLKYLRKSNGLGYGESKALMDTLSVRNRLSKIETLSLVFLGRPSENSEEGMIKQIEEYLDENIFNQ